MAKCGVKRLENLHRLAESEALYAAQLSACFIVRFHSLALNPAGFCGTP